MNKSAKVVLGRVALNVASEVCRAMQPLVRATFMLGTIDCMARSYPPPGHPLNGALN